MLVANAIPKLEQETNDILSPKCTKNSNGIKKEGRIAYFVLHHGDYGGAWCKCADSISDTLICAFALGIQLVKDGCTGDMHNRRLLLSFLACYRGAMVGATSCSDACRE